MQWIEYKRLEISIQMTAEDAQRQLQTLSGKNKAAFKSELSEWLEGTEKVNIEELEYMDFNSTWKINRQSTTNKPVVKGI